MAANNILLFAGVDTGTNLLTQPQYQAATDRVNGNQPGVASSKLVNKALRQSSLVSAALAQFIADHQASDVVDNLSVAQLAAMLNAALSEVGGNLANFTTSGTFNVPSWCTRVYIRGWGGGGGGGGAFAGGAGSGGGGGGYFEGFVLVTPGAAISVTVGAGGTAGVPNVTNGGAGGVTSFGAFATANGGLGGLSTTTGTKLGVNGGTASGSGIFTRQGQTSASSYQIGSVFLGSGGAASPFGGSTAAQSVASPVGANFPGGGGGGAVNDNGAFGASGLLQVFY